MNFKQALTSNSPLLGSVITTPSPEIAECLARCGFHWLFLDTEHGVFEGAAILNVLRAIGDRCHTLVRIPDASPAWFKKALDSGASGIIVPLIKTIDEARQAVALAKYPPLGQRSVGVSRAHAFGMNFQPYLDSANDSVALVLQVEHIAAVRALPEILAIPGIDAILIGPYDLSASMNLPGQVTHPDVQQTIASVRDQCRQKQIPVGIFTMNPDAATAYFKEGYKFVALATDLSWLWTTASKTAASVLATLNLPAATEPAA